MVELVRGVLTASGTAHEVDQSPPSFVGMIKDGDPDWAETSENWLSGNDRHA